MAEAISSPLRTAGGRKGGRLAGWHPADLAASVLNSLVDRSGVDPAQIEDDHGLRDAGRRTVHHHRPQRGDGLEVARERARHFGRPPVRPRSRRCISPPRP